MEDVDFVARVERGYRWLITDGPRYGCDISRINADSIVMADPWRCVLAQASNTGNCFDVVDSINADNPTTESFDWIGHGFGGSPELVPFWQAKLAEHRTQVNV